VVNLAGRHRRGRPGGWTGSHRRRDPLVGIPQALGQEATRAQLVDLIDRHCPKRRRGLTTGRYLALAAIIQANSPRSKRSRRRRWGFPADSPSHPSIFPHHGILRITLEFSEDSRITLLTFYWVRHLASVSVTAAEKRRSPRSISQANRILTVGGCTPLRRINVGGEEQEVGSGVQNGPMVGWGGNGTLVGRRLRLDLPYI